MNALSRYTYHALPPKGHNCRQLQPERLPAAFCVFHKLCQSNVPVDLCCCIFRVILFKIYLYFFIVVFNGLLCYNICDTADKEV